MDKKKWTARLFLILPLLSSIYCLCRICCSSQRKLSKFSQILWFTLALLISETAFEIPQLLWEKESFDERPTTGGRRFSQGVSLSLQLCHLLGFLLVQSYHGLVYAIILTYSPTTYFAHLPGIFIVVTVIANLYKYNLRHVLNRMGQIFTGSVMIYICVLAGNWFGAVGSVFNLFGFWTSKRPTGRLRLDEVYIFLIGVYCSIVIHSLAIRQMIESPVIITDMFPGLTSSYSLAV